MTGLGDRWARATELFARLLDLPADARAGALDAGCAGDPELRAEVETLLRGHAAATPDFLEPAPGPGGEPSAGLSLGSCRLVRVLGEGGMGTVWLARDDALGRDVAVKVLHGGLLGRDALARFAAEAAALARLRHPGIAAVFASGQLPGGPLAPPYLVLELVEGAVPITTWAEQHAASRDLRLRLLAQVADAVQHAHQRGVVHRDLKPGNVLVARDGQPRVIDFGIAQLRDEGQVRQTRYGQVLGTPAYLSPEQCAGDPDLVDAKADVHALGLLGIELLTGRLPYAVDGAPLTEALQTVRFATPARPRSLDGSLSRDLDAVLWKAIAKDPADRYPSAAAFADDVRALLAARPVTARPPRAADSLRLFVRRSPALAATAAVAVLAVLGGALTSTWFGLHAAERAAVAEAERSTAEELADALRDIVRSGNLGVAGRDVTMREALDAAAATIAGRARGKPQVAAELHLVVGDAYRVLGKLDAADAQLQAAAAALQGLAGDHRELAARLQMALGALRALQNRPDDAERVLREAIDLRAALFGPASPGAAEARGRLGGILVSLGRHAAGEAECRAALRDLPEQPPSLTRAEAEANLATACFQQTRIAEAVEHWRAALRLFDAVVPAEHPHRLKTLGALASALRSSDPAGAVASLRELAAAQARRFPEGHPDVALARAQLAFALLDAGDPAAEAEFRAVVELRSRLHGDAHRATAAARNDLGYCLLALDRAADALPVLEQAWTVLQGEKEHPDASGGALLRGLALVRTGDAAAAEPMLRFAVEARTKAFGAASPRTKNAESALGECLLALGRAADAEPLLAAAEPVLAKAMGPDSRETRAARARLAAAYDALGRPADAARFRERR